MRWFYARTIAAKAMSAGPRLWWRAARYLALRASGRVAIRTIFLSPSHRCNANCLHCYEKFGHATRAELSTDEVLDVIDQFARQGGLFVRFCSGEFLLRPDSLDLIRAVRRRGMHCMVTTNGLLLDEPLIDRLVEAGLQELVVSIDSADAERHDELRGVPGCFARATEGLRIAERKGLTTTIWTYVSRSNRHELEAVADLGSALGVSYTFVYFPVLSGHFYDKPEENLTAEEREELRRQFNRRDDVQLEFASEDEECRGGGKHHVCVMPTGDVTFCPPVPFAYGNVRERPLVESIEACYRDHQKFCQNGSCTGQCVVNFDEYRNGCAAEFVHARSPSREVG
jgi:MoaA/NifB/PqqE/SkfB family radical SAM enzyme